MDLQTSAPRISNGQLWFSFFSYYDDVGFQFTATWKITESTRAQAMSEDIFTNRLLLQFRWRKKNNNKKIQVLKIKYDCNKNKNKIPRKNLTEGRAGRDWLQRCSPSWYIMSTMKCKQMMSTSLQWESSMASIYKMGPYDIYPRTFECGPGRTLSAILQKVNSNGSFLSHR